MSDRNYCETCKWYENSTDMHDVRGICHRNPPSVSNGIGFGGPGPYAWTKIFSNDWCGDWEEDNSDKRGER